MGHGRKERFGERGVVAPDKTERKKAGWRVRRRKKEGAGRIGAFNMMPQADHQSCKKKVPETPREKKDEPVEGGYEVRVATVQKS